MFVILSCTANILLSSCSFILELIPELVVVFTGEVDGLSLDCSCCSILLCNVFTINLKETSSNNNRCTGAIQTQSQNSLNENHSINANKHETSPKSQFEFGVLSFKFITIRFHFYSTFHLLS
jgi:hypothetical protein